MANNEKQFQEISSKLMKGDAGSVKALTEKAISDGIEAAEILNKALITAMTEIGIQFKNNDIFLPEVLIAARAMKAGMEIIKPLLVKSNFKAKGKVCIGTVKGDLHDIGKNIVAMMLEGAGYDVIDLGIDVPPEAFVQSVKENQPDVVAMSSLLTTTMLQMKEVVQSLNKESLRYSIKVIIGGAPITQAFADEILADGYAPDAYGAVDLLNQLSSA
jgi:5-methyltetrahydrofolate--homocysteine methyltransferase